MRIGFDAKRAFFNSSGLGNYSRTLIEQLCKLYPEHEYSLFSPKAGRNEYTNFPPLNSETVIPVGFPLKSFPSLWRSFYMGRSIRNLKTDIFHGLSNELPRDIKKSNARSIVTIHDLIFLRFPDLYKRTDRLIYKEKFHRSCELADAVVAISEQTKSDIIQYFNINPSKIHVIYQGCSPLFYEKKSEIEKVSTREKYSLPEKYLLYVGTIEERKNLLQIIKAKHEFNIDLPVVVVGKRTPYFEKVNAYISENGIKDVYFLNSILPVELPGIFQLAEMLIYPSSFEGFGIPILEALNSGIPVISGKGGCMEETGGINTLYVDPANTAEIAEAVKRILSDADLRNTMISEGKSHAMRFRENLTAGEMMKLYEKLL